MPLFQVHFGFQLPFFLALPNFAVFHVTYAGTRHRFHVSGNPERWVDIDHAEAERVRRENSAAPILLREGTTFLTHVRDIEIGGINQLAERYDQLRDEWYDETLRITNKIIDSYMVVTSDFPGQVGPISPWDVGDALVEFMEVTATQTVRVGASQLYVRPDPAPVPLDDRRRLLFEAALMAEVQLPVEDLLHIGAASQIARGRFRNAIVDDVTAFELAVVRQVERLLLTRLPPDIVGQLTTQRFDDLCSWLGPLGGPAIKQHAKWPDAQEARRIRQSIVHDGAAATEAEARFVYETMSRIIEALRVAPMPAP